ncbi:MAG: hypothetical protein Kow0092_12070 [Deferrisomatales bacterium]
MNMVKTAQAAAAPRLAWMAPSLGRWILRGLVFAFCLAAALLLTALRLEITRLEYELSALHARRQAVAADVARLEVELAALAAPKRIEAQARALGLVEPDRGSVVVLDE